MKKKEKKIFQAVLNCHYKELSIKNLLFFLIKYPFLTVKVVLVIYFEALKIFLFKKGKYFKKPVLKSNFTFIKK